MRVVSWILGGLFLVGGAATAYSTYTLAKLPATDPSHDVWQQAILLSGIFTAVVAFAQKAVDAGLVRSRQKELKALRAQFFKVFDGPMVRLFEQVEHMGSLATSSRPAELHALRHNIVRAASQVVASDSARATYFEVEDYRAINRVMTGVTYNYSDNRSDNATSRFDEAALVDREVWSVLDSGRPAIFDDLEKTKPPTWDSSKVREYKSFATYRVHVGEVGVGLLTVNTLKKKELGKADQSILLALAELLSAAESVGRSTQKVREILDAGSARLEKLSEARVKSSSEGGVE